MNFSSKNILRNSMLKECETWNDLLEIIYSAFDYFELPRSTAFSEQVPSRSAIAFLLYICDGVTVGDLLYFFGGMFNAEMLRKTLSRMQGADEVYTMDISYSPLWPSKKSYHLSAKGVNNYLRNMPEWLLPAKQIRRKRPENISVHGYGAGLSLLSVLCGADDTFRYAYEVSSSRSLSKKAGSITSDIAFLFGMNRWRLFIEQDTGSERSFVLFRKLAKYHQGARDFPDDSLVISSYEDTTLPMGNHFRGKSLGEILKIMEENGIEDLYSLASDSILKRLVREVWQADAIRYILLSSGACTSSSGGTLIPSKNRPSCHDEDGSENELIFGQLELKDFIKSCTSRTNSFYYRDMEDIQISRSRKKFRSLAAACIAAQVEDFSSDAVISLSEGFRVYMLPSMHINMYMSELRPLETGSILEKNYRSAAILLYGHEMASACFTALLDTDDAPYAIGVSRVHLRNAYTLENGKKIAFENISKDVGGFLRAFLTYKSVMLNGLEQNLDLICTYDDEDDIVFLLDRISENLILKKEYLTYRKGMTGFHLLFMKRNTLNIYSAAYLNKGVIRLDILH